MKPILVSLPGNDAMANALAQQLGWSRCPATVRRFPDGESFVRVDGDVQGADVVLVCTLDRPDDKLVPLFLLANAARENGARRVGLVAPYLAYMRQDVSFNAGEVVSAAQVAKWISREVDWLVTVDPHLHRIKSLDEVYEIPARVVSATDSIAAWIRQNVAAPLLVGPDEESEQWVASVASRIDAPHVVLTKTRRGDRDVSVSVPEVERWRSHTPVLVDDIISTARTMIETVRRVRECGLADPVCIGVHAIFAQSALPELRAAGAARVVTADTVAHETNAILLAAPLATALRQLCA
jgi:ribose-phosphate pyrophosphokinase